MRIAIAAGLIALAAAPSAAAPFSFACSAPLGRHSELMRVQPGPAYRVRGRIGPVELEEVPDPALPLRMEGNHIPSHARSADVTIMSAGDTANSLTLAVVPRWPGNEADAVAEVTVQVMVDNAVRDEHVLTTIGSRGHIWDDVAFDIQVGEDRVTVEAGGRREEIALTLGRGATLYVACVGGSFDFDDLDWDG